MPYNKLLMAFAALSLSACASTQPATQSAAGNIQGTFGLAVAQNMDAQKVAPSDAQKENTYIPANRKRQQAAREAYEAGEVKDLIGLGTGGED